MAPPSCSQSLSHLLCQICVHPLVLLGGKTVGPRAPVSKVESKTFHRRKGTLQAFSRSLDIDVLVLLVFLEDGYSGWLNQLPESSGLKLGSDRIWALFGFLLNWNRDLSHGWIHVVSKTFLSRTS